MPKNMNKSISVWLELIDGSNKGKFALQKRGEKEVRFLFVCQPTWAGKVEENESVETAIERECEEELGKNFKDNFDFSALKFVGTQKYTFRGEYWQSYNYLGKIKQQDLELAQLHSEAEPQFIFAGKQDKVFDIKSAKSPKFDVVLFDDQYKIFKKILG
jgi:ADP-ribose pyrophosphatase YjhB (NUDIX family)